MIKTVNRKDIEDFVSFVLHNMIPDYEVKCEADSFCVTCFFPDLKLGDPAFDFHYKEIESRYFEALDILLDTDYFSFSYTTRNNTSGDSFAVKLLYSSDIQVD